jgi:ketosteroid isomerase-like protein
MLRISIFIFLLAVIEFAEAQDKNANNIRMFTSARDSSNTAIANHDIDGFARFWYDDFVQVRGNGTHLTGKDTIMATWRQLFNNNPKVAYVRVPSKIIISTNDTLAWETGSWKAYNSYSKGGNYSAMWRKSGNTWKIQSELFVSLF